MLNKNLTLQGGHCPHRRYLTHRVERVRSAAADPSKILTHVSPLTRAIEAYEAFDLREPGWIKVELLPAA